SPSRTTELAFPRKTSTDYSSAITAAATFPASLGPAWDFTSSRWWPICMAAASRSTAGKAKEAALRSGCRSNLPPSRGGRTGNGRGGISRRGAAHGVEGEPRSDLIAIEAYDGAGAEPSTCRQQLFHLALRLLLSGCEVAR